MWSPSRGVPSCANAGAGDGAGAGADVASNGSATVGGGGGAIGGGARALAASCCEYVLPGEPVSSSVTKVARLPAKAQVPGENNRRYLFVVINRTTRHVHVAI